MNPANPNQHTPPDESYEEFVSCVTNTTHKPDWPQASKVEKNILCYDGDSVRKSCENATNRDQLKDEWYRALSTGPGVIAITNAFENTQTLDTATELFSKIIDEEKPAAAKAGGGDHFAKAGANDRLWNAIQKHCLRDPENFIQYFSNQAIALACEAWLGDGYQMTTQINRVNPGGAAQSPHRDYHLGFMPIERMKKFPAHVHALSPALTLQGAVAHCDMPLETGPTQYLPYSQRFAHGYTHFSQPQYQNYFHKHHVQLELQKGDVAFFNPAVMHGAGSNTTPDKFRLANLLQISSAFGRAMESVDRTGMVKALYPLLLNNQSACHAAVIAASAEGYAFPTNLDIDPPADGMSPTTQADLMTLALKEQWDTAKFHQAIDAQQQKRQA